MLITRSNVFIKSTYDDELEPAVEENVVIIDGDLMLLIIGHEWSFHKFTGKLDDGTPVVDLDLSEQFEVTFSFDKEEVDLEWLMSATFLEIIRKYSKKLK
ncbi:hypothetical protein [Heyndrickxia ginsengihumi]|uniref:hypothetical protein n=1 Tax=Heyndrickxia ginsengihumi TaxID=363870 RepID=UPI003D1AFB99